MGFLLHLNHMVTMAAALLSLHSRTRMKCRWTTAAAVAAARCFLPVRRTMSSSIIEPQRSSSFERYEIFSNMIPKPATTWRMQTVEEKSVGDATLRTRDYLGEIEKVLRDLYKKLEHCIGDDEPKISIPMDDDLDLEWALRILNKKLEKILFEAGMGPLGYILNGLMELADMFLTKYPERYLLLETDRRKCHVDEHDFSRKTACLGEMEMVLHDLNSKLADLSEVDEAQKPDEWEMEHALKSLDRKLNNLEIAGESVNDAIVGLRNLISVFLKKYADARERLKISQNCTVTLDTFLCKMEEVAQEFALIDKLFEGNLIKHDSCHHDVGDAVKKLLEDFHLSDEEIVTFYVKQHMLRLENIHVSSLMYNLGVYLLSCTFVRSTNNSLEDVDMLFSRLQFRQFTGLPLSKILAVVENYKLYLPEVQQSQDSKATYYKQITRWHRKKTNRLMKKPYEFWNTDQLSNLLSHIDQD